MTLKKPEKSCRGFFDIPASPSLLIQGGALLTLGGGLLARQLDKAAAPGSLLAALAVEGLRIVSLIGITAFLVGCVKSGRRKESKG